MYLKGAPTPTQRRTASSASCWRTGSPPPPRRPTRLPTTASSGPGKGTRWSGWCAALHPAPAIDCRLELRVPKTSSFLKLGFNCLVFRLLTAMGKPLLPLVKARIVAMVGGGLATPGSKLAAGFGFFNSVGSLLTASGLPPQVSTTQLVSGTQTMARTIHYPLGDWSEKFGGGSALFGAAPGTVKRSTSWAAHAEGANGVRALPQPAEGSSIRERLYESSLELSQPRHRSEFRLQS
jgi:hypothetical protein